MGEIRHLPTPGAVEATSPKRKAKRLDRARAGHRVLQLAAAGLTNREIAEQMKASDATTYRSEHSVKRFLSDTLKQWSELNSEHLSEYREMKLFELDQLRRAVWKEALIGDTDSVREARAIIKLQLEMSGAGAPVKHEHKHTIGMDLDESEIKQMEQAWVDADSFDIPEAEVVGELESG